MATDHPDIVREIRRLGGDVRMTARNLATGTDRVAEVAKNSPDVDIIVNVQGDEPELAGSSIDRVVEMLIEDPSAVMATLATPIRSPAQWEDPACVKVVVSAAGEALYFSRSPIPHVRELRSDHFDRANSGILQHVGLYAYRREFLLQLTQTPPTPLEQLECLEQLRVLETGHSIRVDVVDEYTFGIDTRADYEAFVQRAASR